jgi:hypothetical protein
MDVIQQITLKTAEGSVEATGSIGDLSKMVKAMHDSVAGFKLPGVDSLNNDMDDMAKQNLDSFNG